PKCQKTGSPVDVYKAHRIWSALILSSWSSHPEISCKKCAVKRQIGAVLFCGTLGWWGFPWGVIGTPVQIIRNFCAMVANPKAGQPSPLLLNHVKVTVGQKLAIDLQNEQAEQSIPPALPPQV
ncbi:MAG: hypothetical protein Q7Q71_04610, partial [Verrucomicrobiota bacterium JB023]|nr:hypothetical protein [Verrucomicrobiota bacterium JB023]